MTALVVTRPAREAQLWVDTLRQAGHDAQALPLIDIAGAPDAAALARDRAHIRDFDALMFVSAQAVDRFWAEPGPVPADGVPRCWAPGPGTARALLGAGVPAACVDQPSADAGQFDSEALWAVVAPQVQAGHRLLLVHGVSADGHSGRDWLAQQCENAGGQVRRCAAYRRQAPHWGKAEQACVQQALAQYAWWLFSSSEALLHLQQLCPGQNWASARALVTHPRIAERARALGFGLVQATRPALPDVLCTLESLP